MPKMCVKEVIIIIGLAMPLAACSMTTAKDNASAVTGATKDAAVAVGAGVGEAAGHASNLAGAAKEDAYDLTDHVANWLRPEKNTQKSIASSYCYHALQDIMCYHQPMPGWENRLVAYQGTDSKSPPPARMQLLPKQTVDMSTLPENRVANSKPVFSAMPVSVKQEDKGSDQPQVVDSSHEQLPDPALAPQL